MPNRIGPLFVALALAAGSAAMAQNRDADELKIAALEALISAPPERALPLVTKVLRGNNSDEVKESALFILSQIDTAEAQNLLLETARQSKGDLQTSAIEMIGIGGNPDTLASLRDIYKSGNRDVRQAVLDAYLIAGDRKAVFEIAVNAESEDDFEDAVEMLGAMGASEELRQLKSRIGVSESLIDAYAISGDFESLRELATDGSDADAQVQAIEALGIVGGSEADTTLLQIYRDASSDEVREAALDGMLISGYDEGVLELYRASDSPAEKRELLQYLTMMDSDAIWEIIDAALDGERR